jgi:predicted RNA methylase
MHAFYEDVALDAAFDQVQMVFELGCGTGRLAFRLLMEHLPPTASYLAMFAIRNAIWHICFMTFFYC